MNQRFYDAVEESPVIGAVKDFEGLEKCCGIEVDCLTTEGDFVLLGVWSAQRVLIRSFIS